MISIFLYDSLPGQRADTERFLLATGRCRVSAYGPWDVMVVFDSGQGQDGLEQLARAGAEDPDLPVVFVAAAYNPEVASKVWQHRAEYVVMTSPADAWLQTLLPVIEKAAELRHLKTQVAWLNKKLNLVGSVTRHDVLNQLTAVNGYTELLAMMIEDPKLRSFLEKEQFAVNKIRRLFQFAKDYQNIASEPPQWQLVSPTLHRAGEQSNQKTLTVDDACGNISVYADLSFEKVFFSLFDNTLRHGTNVTKIRVYTGEENNEPVIIFEDNGTGIPAEDKEKIFEKGFGKNTGLGLFLAREILAVTGMTIKETGEPGKGARFVIRIPPSNFRNGPQ